MALTDTNQETGSQAQVSSNFGNNQQAQQPQQQAAQPQAGLSLFGTNGMFGAPVPVNPGGESLSKIVKAMETIFQDTPAVKTGGLELTLMALDRNQDTNLAFSAIIVCAVFLNSPQKIVAAHTLLLESTGNKLLPIQQNINNKNVEITRVTSEAYNDVLGNMVIKKVNDAYKGYDVILVDSCVVPTGFDPADVASMQQLAANAAAAVCTGVYQSQSNFADFAIGTMPQNTTMAANLSFNRQQMKDPVGNMIRSDVIVSMSARRSGPQNSNQLNAEQTERKFGELTGFIDLVYSPTQPQTMGWGVQPNQEPKYVSRLVITNVTSEFGLTIGSILFNIWGAAAIQQNNNWMQAFKPNTIARNKVDLHDIGAMNIDADVYGNACGKVDLKSEKVTPMDFGQYLQRLLRQGLMFSIDVPSGGPQSWYTSVFNLAAGGDNGAISAIIASANQLTGGRFARHFPANAQIFTGGIETVHLGTWENSDGKRDIRDIDTVAVANLFGSKNPAEIAEWSDTFFRTEYPEQLRLAGRKRAIDAATNNTADYTDYARRLTFSSEFISALVVSLNEATGGGYQVITSSSTSEFSSQRGIASFANSALVTANLVPMNYGYVGQQPQQQFHSFQGNNRFN